MVAAPVSWLTCPAGIDPWLAIAFGKIRLQTLLVLVASTGRSFMVSAGVETAREAHINGFNPNACHS